MRRKVSRFARLRRPLRSRGQAEAAIACRPYRVATLSRSQPMIKSAIARLFFSIISMWLLPWWPASGSSRNRAAPPAALIASTALEQPLRRASGAKGYRVTPALRTTILSSPCPRRNPCGINFPSIKTGASQGASSSDLCVRESRLATDDACQRVPRAGRTPRSFRPRVIASSVIAPALCRVCTMGNRAAAKAPRLKFGPRGQLSRPPRGSWDCRCWRLEPSLHEALRRRVGRVTHTFQRNPLPDSIHWHET
jgi:hypothetical protein